jgi:hypothetical protein
VPAHAAAIDYEDVHARKRHGSRAGRTCKVKDATARYRNSCFDYGSVLGFIGEPMIDIVLNLDIVLSYPCHP